MKRVLKALTDSFPLLLTILHKQRALVYLFLLVGWLSWMLSPPQPLTFVGPPQTVVTNNRKVGVHTRLTDEVEEWKIQRTLQMVREMGASWIVEYFPWAYSEPQKGNYLFGHADMVVNHARAQGLTIIARIDLVPAWARPANSGSQRLASERYADYGDFVFAFVRHFKGRIRHLQIWNEPNLTNEWGGRPPDPQAYVELLEVAYRRAKEADPEIIVLAGALSPTLESDRARAMPDLDYLRAMYAAGAQPHFDALAIHAYGLRAPADAPAASNALNFRRAELLREVMTQNGDAQKSAFITEGGWNDHPRWAFAVRPAQRAAYTVQAYQLAQREWAWCTMVALWAFRFPGEQHNFHDYFSFVTPQFLPKPVYQMVRESTRP